MSKISFKVNMHCATCSINIDKTLKKVGIISQSNPVLKITKILDMKNSKMSEKDIIKVLKGIGYEAVKK